MSTITVNAKKAPKFKENSARAIWFAALKKHNGKTVEEFVKAMADKPPVLTKKGKGEAPMGWVRYFEREGVIKVG
jgi:hypothetical protein